MFEVWGAVFRLSKSFTIGKLVPIQAGKMARFASASSMLVTLLMGAMLGLNNQCTSAQPFADSLRHRAIYNRPGDDALQYYISVSGDDSKSGKTQSEAFASIYRALAEVRNLKKAGGGKLPNSVQFNFLADGGHFFELNDTVSITPLEGGDEASIVLFTNYDTTMAKVRSGSKSKEEAKDDLIILLNSSQ